MLDSNSTTTLAKNSRPSQQRSPFLWGLIIIVILILSYFIYLFLRVNAYAGLQIKTPENLPVEVLLDGQVIGSTPFYHDKLTPGEYLLTLKPLDSNYLSFDRKITLHSNYLAVVDWNPATSAEKAWGVFFEPAYLADLQLSNRINIESTPDNVLVRIDNQDEGLITPQTLTNLGAGPHQLNFILPSHERLETKIDLSTKQELNIFVKLAAANNNLLQDQASLAGQLSGFDSGRELSAFSSAPNKPLGSILIITSTKTMIDGQEALILRSKPDANSSAIVTLPVGSEITYLGEESNGFYKVQTGQRTAWADRKFVRFR